MNFYYECERLLQNTSRCLSKRIAEEEESKKRKKELEQLEENKNKWYENLIGKYFILKFNFEVTGFVYIDKSLFEQNSRRYTLYEKYKSRDKISVSIEKHRLCGLIILI